MLTIFLGIIYMNQYILNYTIEKVLENIPSKEQKLLAKYTNLSFDKKESEYLWKRVNDHKWYISERLGRDIGLKVAAIDFIENFYEPKKVKSKNTNIYSLIYQYFTSKSKNPAY